MYLYNKKFRYFSKDCKTSCSSCNSKCTVNDFLTTDVGVMNVILEPSVTVLLNTRTNRTYDELRRTPGLSRKSAVFVDDLKYIGYCVNGYPTPVRKWWLHTHRFRSRVSVVYNLTLTNMIPGCRGKYRTTTKFGRHFIKAKEITQITCVYSRVYGNLVKED